MSKISWRLLESAAKSYKRILITSHVRPDGDALGSELAAAALLKAMGCRCKIINVSPTPGNLFFLDPKGTKFHLWTEKNTSSWIRKNFDAALVVDTSSQIQLDKAAEPILTSALPLIIIDHHTVGDKFNALLLCNNKADSTGLLITQAFEALNIPISAATAQALFTAICTDTGWFRFPSVKPETFTAAAKLVECGAHPAKLYANLFEKYPFARLKMQGVIMNNAKQYFNDKLIISFAKQSDFEKYNASPADLEGIINQLLTIAGTEVAIILTQQVDSSSRNIVKLNFRSKTSFNVAELAKSFGGGGHVQASGASVVADSIEQIYKSVLKKLEGKL